MTFSFSLDYNYKLFLCSSKISYFYSFFNEYQRFMTHQNICKWFICDQLMSFFLLIQVIFHHHSIIGKIFHGYEDVSQDNIYFPNPYEFYCQYEL